VDESGDVAVDLQRLLDELCVGYGFCLPPQAQEQLRRSRPPFDVDEFTDAVFAAEGMDPLLNKTLRRKVRERVERHLVAMTARLHGDPLGTYTAIIERIDLEARSRRHRRAKPARGRR
jgi:hypothetical protein